MKKRSLKLIIITAITLLLCLGTLVGCFSSPTVGIADTEINELGELIITYTDGTSKNLGVIVGQNGKDGVDGKDGLDGEKGDKGDKGSTGAVGKDGVDGKDGSLVISGDIASNAAAIATGLRSSVSILAAFTKNTYGTPTEYYAAGSGVIYKTNDTHAFIITNYHVVYDSASNATNGISNNITVYLYGSEYADYAIGATYVGGSMQYDIAVLAIEKSELTSFSATAAVFNSDVLSVGETAIAIGNAQGEGISASVGIVCVDSEYITMTGADEETEVDFRVMRIDTAVNSGNSGGGLFNSRGELIGIVNAKIIDSNVENIGYAIPSNLATAVADNIITNCYNTSKTKVQRALIGVTVIATDSKAVYDTESGKVSIVEEITVNEVSYGSLSYGKLESGDVFVTAKLGETEIAITRQHQIIDLLLRAKVGDTVEFTVLRDGTPSTVSMTVTISAITEVQ